MMASICYWGGVVSHTGRAMIVPLRSLPGAVTVPVGVLDPAGVALDDVSVDVSASRDPGRDRSVEAGSTSIDSS